MLTDYFKAGARTHNLRCWKACIVVSIPPHILWLTNRIESKTLMTLLSEL